MSETRQKLVNLASHVGGSEGKALAKAIRQANTPDLSYKTRVHTQIDRLLESLGGYNPNEVPIRIKKRMRRDPQLRFGVELAKAPIISAPFHFECDSVEVKALLKDVFIDSGFLRNLCRTSTQAFEFGFANHEQLWERRDEHEVSWFVPRADGGMDRRTKKHAGLFVPQRFKDLDPERVALLKDEYGRLAGSTFGAVVGSWQDLQNKIRKREVNVLAPSKMFLFTPVFEWQNYWGEGQYEWAYDYWYWQKILYAVALRWFERKADPPYVAYAPSTTFLPDPGMQDDEATYDPDDETTDSLVHMSRIIERLRSAGSVTLPSEVFTDDEGRPSSTRAYSIEEVGVKDMHPAFIEMIDHLDKKKTRAIIMPDAILARDKQVASLGAPDRLAELVIDHQNSSLGLLIDAIQEQVLVPFLRYNGIKDRVRVCSTGVSRENREVIKEVLLKLIDSDTLSEQAHGQRSPKAYTQTIDREQIARTLGVPFHAPDPNAPLPPPPPAPNPEGSSKEKKKRTNLALAAGDDFYARVQDEAAEFEEWVSGEDATRPYRAGLEDHEKAVAAILLWLLLRGRKGGDKDVPAPDKGVDRLVFDDKSRWLSAKELALVYPELARRAADLEGRGLVLESSGSAALVRRARAGITQTLGTMPDTLLATKAAEEFLLPAVQQARGAVAGLLAEYHPGREVKHLDPEEVASIVALNAEGLLINIENIAIRNGRSMVEKVLMAFGNRRQLGVVDDVLTFRFNRLYSDLTLEAHLRSVYRKVVVDTALKSGVAHFIMVSASPMPADDDLVGRVQTYAWWTEEGERRGAPNPITQFGFHHNSRSFWYPSPPRALSAAA